MSIFPEQVKKLNAINIVEVSRVMQEGINTSQTGEYSCFRNEMHSDHHVYGPNFLRKLPDEGVFKCDFVSMYRPKHGTRNISQLRLKALINKLELHRITPLVQEFQAAADDETKRLLRMKMKSEVPDFFTQIVCKNYFNEFIDSCHHNLDIYPRERMRDVSRGNYSNTSRPTTPESMKLSDGPSSEYMISFPFILWKMLHLQIILPAIYVSAQQAHDILSFFPAQNYCRVQVFLSLFNHILDFGNLDKIIDGMFTHDEKTEVFHRLGYLNVIDSLKPDRKYVLDLRRWDHREMAKILVRLACDEPGENWVNEEYRWSKYDDPVPGWMLPVGWTLNDSGNPQSDVPETGMRRHGWLKLTYTSTGKDCAPNMATRKRLRKYLFAGLKKSI